VIAAKLLERLEHVRNQTLAFTEAKERICPHCSIKSRVQRFTRY